MLLVTKTLFFGNLRTSSSIELSIVKPVSHDDCRFYEGKEFVFAATYNELHGCEVDTMQEIQDDIKNDYKKFQSAPTLSADCSQGPG